MAPRADLPQASDFNGLDCKTATKAPIVGKRLSRALSNRKRQPRWREPLLSDYDPNDFYFDGRSQRFVYIPTNEAWVNSSIKALFTREQIVWIKAQQPPANIGRPSLRHHRF